MKKTMRRARLLACAVSIPVVSVSSSAHADDRPLIWSPSKLSDTAYNVRVGVKLPTDMETSVGADLGIAAYKTGQIPDGGTPVRVWGKLTRRAGSASNAQQDVNVEVNALTGDSRVGVARSRKWAVTPDLDLESRDAFSISCNNSQKHCYSKVTPSARLINSTTGTALVAQGAFYSDATSAQSSIGIERNILGKFNVGVSVINPISSPAGSVTARYAFNW